MVGPGARQGCGGGGAAHPRLGEPGADEAVEERRLPAAGGSGQGHHGVVQGVPLPRGGLLQDLAGLGQRPPVQPRPGQPHEFAQRVEAGP